MDCPDIWIRTNARSWRAVSDVGGGGDIVAGVPARYDLHDESGKR